MSGSPQKKQAHRAEDERNPSKLGEVSRREISHSDRAVERIHLFEIAVAHREMIARDLEPKALRLLWRGERDRPERKQDGRNHQQRGHEEKNSRSHLQGTVQIAAAALDREVHAVIWHFDQAMASESNASIPRAHRGR